MNAPARAAALFGAGSLPKVAWGKGSYVYDTAGKRYIDGSCGPAVYCLGHGNEEVNAAIARQLDQDRPRLSLHLHQRSAGGIDRDRQGAGRQRPRAHGVRHRRLGGGGVLPQDRAAVSRRARRDVAPPLHRARALLARQYAGRALRLRLQGAARAVRRRAPRRLPPVAGERLSPARERARRTTSRAPAPTSWSRRSCASAPTRSPAFIFEPVVGAAGGAVPAPPGYARAVREICDRHGVLMIADEVMCGTGRCGTWRALEHDGVVPDIMAIAKGLAGGYLPLGAAVYHTKVAEPIFAVHGAAAHRPHLLRPHRLLRRRRRRADHHQARRSHPAR